jgi:transposase
MKRLTSKPPSGRQHRLNWKERMPPVKYRVFIADAVELAGSPSNLAKILGITRSAVYQWRPPYRNDPYMPEKMAKRLLDENPDFRVKLEP